MADGDAAQRHPQPGGGRPRWRGARVRRDGPRKQGGTRGRHSVGKVRVAGGVRDERRGAPHETREDLARAC